MQIAPGDADVMAQTLWAGVHGALALPIHMEPWGLADARCLVAAIRASLMTALLQSPLAGAAHLENGVNKP